MRGIVVSVAIALLAPSLARAQSQGTVQVPPGWQMAQRTDGVEITPPDLRAGEVFVATMMPEEEPRGRSLRDWMIAKVKVDSPRQGRVIEKREIQADAGGSLLQRLTIETRRGDRLLLLYIAAPSPRQKFQLLRVLSSPDQQFYGPLMATAARIVSGQPPEAIAARERRPAREVERDLEPRSQSRKPVADPAAALRTEPRAELPPARATNTAPTASSPAPSSSATATVAWSDGRCTGATRRGRDRSSSTGLSTRDAIGNGAADRLRHDKRAESR
jgi:hypothetical protein